MEELKSKLEADKAAYAYVRMTVGNDEYSKRAKFVFITWCGPEVKVMRRAKISVHGTTVKAVIKSFAVEVAASSIKDLNEADITLLLKKAMGANYDRQSSNY